MRFNDINLLEPRIQAKIEVAENGCWIWTGARDSKGYGRVGCANRKTKFSHRFVYEVLVGDPGPELDHLCRTPACCNPLHLEPVSHLENVRRGASGPETKRRWAEHRYCPKGHPLFGDNLYTHTTQTGYVNKLCKTCRREAGRRHYWRAKDQAKTS